MSNRYVEAARGIRRGETRTYLEIAAQVGRSGAARAVSRALRLAGDDAPWHRVVPARGALPPEDGRAGEQLERLRTEGARPREREQIAAWARRRNARLVGNVAKRTFLPADDPRAMQWPAHALEPFRDEESARERGYHDLDRGPSPIPEPPGVGVRPRSPVDPNAVLERLDRAVDDAFRAELAASGVARAAGLLTANECASILAGAVRFERSIDMASFGYGRGAYHYIAEPLPEPALTLRTALYARLQAVAADHGEFPRTLDELWRRSRAAGQRRSSSILLCCGADAVNHLHRDVYGEVRFPYQALVCLSHRGRDFEGGEFVLAEEHGIELRHRAIPVDRGDLVVFATTARIDRTGSRRRKVELRHGMTRVTRGTRFGLGIVFPLAR